MLSVAPMTPDSHTGWLKRRGGIGRPASASPESLDRRWRASSSSSHSDATADGAGAGVGRRCASAHSEALMAIVLIPLPRPTPGLPATIPPPTARLPTVTSASFDSDGAVTADGGCYVGTMPGFGGGRGIVD
jgi:hypothetical protein